MLIYNIDMDTIKKIINSDMTIKNNEIHYTAINKYIDALDGDLSGMELRSDFRLRDSGFSPYQVSLTVNSQYASVVCACYDGQNMTYWASPLYSGIWSGNQYYTYGIVDISSICSNYHIDSNSISDVYLTFTGSNNSSYTVWTNSGTTLIGAYTSSDNQYVVPYWNSNTGMANSDFSISLTQSGGFVSFYSSFTVTIVYGVLKKTDMSTGQAFDIYLPSDYNTSNHYPVVLTVHGGAWCQGSRNAFDNHMKYITGSGCVHVNMDYHLTSYTGQSSVSAHTMISDIDAVLNRLVNSYSDYIITSKICLYGYSAGAHLVLLYTYTRNSNNPSPIPIKLLISESGPTDLGHVYPTGIQQLDASSNDAGIILYKNISGYSGADTGQLISALDSISPYQIIPDSCKNIRTLLVYSTADDLVTEGHASHLKTQLTNYDEKPFSIYDHETMQSRLWNSSSYYAKWKSEINAFISL